MTDFGYEKSYNEVSDREGLAEIRLTFAKKRDGDLLNYVFARGYGNGDKQSLAASMLVSECNLYTKFKDWDITDDGRTLVIYYECAYPQDALYVREMHDVLALAMHRLTDRMNPLIAARDKTFRLNDAGEVEKRP